MNLVVPYCRLHPQTKLAAEPYQPRYVDTSTGPTAHWECLRDLWAAQQTVILLEQDKVPEDGALQELWDCPQPWCYFPVPMANTDECPTFPQLCATKLTRSMMLQAPRAIEDAGAIELGFGPRHWNRLDLAVWMQLEYHFGATHRHQEGRVAHLHQPQA